MLGMWLYLTDQWQNMISQHKEGCVFPLQTCSNVHIQQHARTWERIPHLRRLPWAPNSQDLAHLSKNFSFFIFQSKNLSFQRDDYFHESSSTEANGVVVFSYVALGSGKSVQHKCMLAARRQGQLRTHQKQTCSKPDSNTILESFSMKTVCITLTNLIHTLKYAIHYVALHCYSSAALSI